MVGFAPDIPQAETDILAISAASGKFSTFQQASITRRIMGAGMMPSARSVNFASSCWSVIGFSTLPMADPTIAGFAAKCVCSL